MIGNRLRLGLLVAVTLTAWAGPGRAEDHCPSNPSATYQVDLSDTSGSRSTMESIAGLAKEKGAVCILAYTDAQDSTHAKTIALHRANWVRDNLTADGVSRDSISIELRPPPDGADRSAVSVLQVILGN